MSNWAMSPHWHETPASMLRDQCRRGSRKIIRGRGGGWLQGNTSSRHNREDGHRNSQRLWQIFTISQHRQRELDTKPHPQPRHYIQLISPGRGNSFLQWCDTPHSRANLMLRNGFPTQNRICFLWALLLLLQIGVFIFCLFGFCFLSCCFFKVRHREKEYEFNE